MTGYIDSMFRLETYRNLLTTDSYRTFGVSKTERPEEALPVDLQLSEVQTEDNNDVPQILDDKRDCLGLFSRNGEFYYGQIKRAFEKTWDWSPHLSDDDYEYAPDMECGGKSHLKSLSRTPLRSFGIHKKKS